MAEEIKANQTESKPKRGGKRAGAGRKAEAIAEYRARFFRGRGFEPMLAEEILRRCADTERVFRRLLNSTDDRVVLQAITWLISMRDGKPAQAINVTSTNITLQSRDIETARAIVREIRGEAALLPQAIPATTSPLQVDADTATRLADSYTTPDGDTTEGEYIEEAESMLLGGEGGNKGG